MFLSTQFLILAVLLGIGAAMTIIYEMHVRRAARALSEAERARFKAEFNTRADRENMPPKFDRLAAATDRARGGRAGASLLMVIGLLYYAL